MSRYIPNVVNFKEYKEKRKKQLKLELDRAELLQLIKKVVTTK